MYVRIRTISPEIRGIKSLGETSRRILEDFGLLMLRNRMLIMWGIQTRGEKGILEENE